jgi:non-canonical poly(A) RNA polymerase PAPD5/7
LNFAEDEGAPQQFLGGAEDGHAKFVDVDTSDSDESDEEDVSATAPSRKRVKTSGAAVSEGSERPKWSNPDPYSVLPPTNMDVAPKKDIIQTIRKAKVEAANQAGGTNSIKDNDDFISFDFGEDKPAADDVSSDGDDNDFVGASAPVAPPKKSRTRNAQAPATRNNGTKRKFDTTDIGVDDNGSQRELDAADMSVGNVVPEWRANGTDPTPWLKVDDTSKLNVGLQLVTTYPAWRTHANHWAIDYTRRLLISTRMCNLEITRNDVAMI